MDAMDDMETAFVEEMARIEDAILEMTNGHDDFLAVGAMANAMARRIATVKDENTARTLITATMYVLPRAVQHFADTEVIEQENLRVAEKLKN